MLNAVLVALTLEGVLPGLVRIRRPTAVVRYDRIREPRARTNLRAIARALLGTEPQPLAVMVRDERAPETRSSSLATGAHVVFFRET